ncbi:hypothetical protein [Rhabdochromatium marinum]|uniref:hypothetical protein n=1 Tax=Rhabdochromatium marinum TaxID=48729 RepID=UPI001907CE24|nr:hypothetical protein [Rhabdochromatium marinum]
MALGGDDTGIDLVGLPLFERGLYGSPDLGLILGVVVTEGILECDGFAFGVFVNREPGGRSGDA